MTDNDDLSRALRLNAAGCHALGSPFSGALLERAADDVVAGGPTRELLAPWQGIPTRALIEAAVSLRLLGGLHDLVLSGDAPALATTWPTVDRPGDAAAAWSEALAAILAHGERLAAFMNHEPQTNEVARSAALLGGFLTIAGETGLPLCCFELGASAGLNQIWDRYRYRLGEACAWGATGAPVAIATQWRGPPPPLDSRVAVIERGACDRKPVDLADPAARRRLAAFVWADQVERLARLKAAMEAALAAGVKVEAEDAVSWTRHRVSPREGAATVLFHSVFWQYMPAESQAALSAAIEALGARATRSAPLAWLRMEPPATTLAMMEVRLTLWPGGENRLLAHAHPHGAWVEWKGGEAG